MPDTDIVIVGAGAAGLSLAHRLTSSSGGRGPAVLLIEAPQGPSRPPERTWCFWEASGGAYDDALSASWGRLRVRGTDGTQTVGQLAPMRYKMLRSSAFETFVGRRLAGPSSRCSRLEAVVESVRDRPGGAEVRGHDAAGRTVALKARWAFDSRPPRRLPPARTTLLQHFRGWFVRTEQPAFDPRIADLMDFRTNQPRDGLSFGYLLPLGPRDALVEYTQFSRTALGTDQYDRALHHYTDQVLGLGPFSVIGSEQGVIPMTDARFPSRVGRSVFPIGAAGGATRPSTGYTFTAVQRQTRALATDLLAGRAPRPCVPYSRRSLLMDAVLLRALDSGRIDGAAFFTGLFRRVPTERLLRFLDGRTRPYEEFLIGLHTPVLPMLRTVAELPRLPRR